MAHLEALRGFAGAPLPEQTMAELRRLMARHRLASEHLHDIEAARDRVLTVARPDREERMIQLPVQIVGLGVETATVLRSEGRRLGKESVSTFRSRWSPSH